ncbi:MAG: ammonia channel protein, partial [Beijerinckiaceae bacterium]
MNGFSGPACRLRLRAGTVAAVGLLITGSGALAQTSTPKIDGADTGFMIIATAFVLMMTLPGLALFYAGMVRKKNVLATLAQSVAALAVVSLLWVIAGYSLSFPGDGKWLGDFSRVFL